MRFLAVSHGSSLRVPQERFDSPRICHLPEEREESRRERLADVTSFERKIFGNFPLPGKEIQRPIISFFFRSLSL